MTTEKCRNSMVVDVEMRLPATRNTEVNQQPNTAPFSQNDLLGCASLTNKSFPFKALPREIRDVIYNYVFQFDRIAASAYRCFVSMPDTAESTQSGSRCNPQIMLALLFVDRETFREAAEQFYGHRLFSIGSSVYPHSSIQFLKGIGKRRLDLIGSLKYSVMLCGDGHCDASGKWHQTFWQLPRSQWRATFRYLSQARGLRTLEIDLGATGLTRSGLTPNEWSEMETCLVGIKGRVELYLCNGCQVFVKDNPVECEGMTSIMASHKNIWKCKQGETEWGPMESVYTSEWYGEEPEGMLKRSYKELDGACLVQRTL